MNLDFDFCIHIPDSIVKTPACDICGGSPVVFSADIVLDEHKVDTWLFCAAHWRSVANAIAAMDGASLEIKNIERDRIKRFVRENVDPNNYPSLVEWAGQ